MGADGTMGRSERGGDGDAGLAGESTEPATRLFPYNSVRRRSGSSASLIFTLSISIFIPIILFKCPKPAAPLPYSLMPFKLTIVSFLFYQKEDCLFLCKT